MPGFPDPPSASVTELKGQVLWTREIHGVAGQNPSFGPAGAALYLSDGWGNRPAPALRFRRFDASSGEETGRWPCGSTVRCLVPLDGGDLLVATDQRLARLDATTLVERDRWNRGIRHATTMAVSGGIAAAGNSAMPTVSLLELSTGALRRRRHGPALAILGRTTGDPILVGGSPASLSLLDPTTGDIRRLRSLPSAMAAALSADELGVWLVTGVRAVVDERPGGVSVRPGDAVTRLEWHPLDGGEPLAIDAPLPVRTIAVDAGSLWLTPGPLSGTPQHLAIRAPDGGWRVWRPPYGEMIDAVAPAAGLVITSIRVDGAERRAMTCHRVAA